MGNYTLGIKEHTVFPETADEELKDVFGMAVTVVTSAKDKKEAQSYFAHLGFLSKKLISFFEKYKKQKLFLKEEKAALDAIRARLCYGRGRPVGKGGSCARHSLAQSLPE